MSNLTDVEKFFAKAGCRRPGAQATARRLWGRIAYMFRDKLEREILVEWEHVLMGEGRHKLDGIAAEVLPRLVRGTCPRCGALHGITLPWEPGPAGTWPCLDSIQEAVARCSARRKAGRELAAVRRAIKLGEKKR